MSDQKYLSLTWDDIYKQCEVIASKIKSNPKNIPDTIIAIGRGGMIPARILSDMLNVKNVQMYNIQMYTGVNTKGAITQSFNGNVYKCNVLLVDDIVDSGKTIDCAITNISGRDANSIRVASLLCKKSVTRKPSYYADDCENDVWVVYPWEIKEFPQASH